MKKYLLFGFLFVLFPFTTFAVSGACSYHGGVNCTIGSSALGEAICNDGWVSSTNFFDTDECKTSLPVCSQPYIWGYTDISSCDQQQNLCNSFNASRYQSCIMGGSSGCTLSTNCPEADACKTQVANNNASQQRYDQCWETVKKYQAAKLQSISNQTAQLNVQIHDGECQLKFGPNSNYDQQTIQCACQKGFWYDQTTKLCEIPSDSCAMSLGQYSQVNAAGTDCECIAGYQTTLLSEHCVLKPHESTTTVSGDLTNKGNVSNKGSAQITEKVQKAVPTKKVITQTQQEKTKNILPIIVPTITLQITTTSTSSQIKNENVVSTTPQIVDVPKRSVWDQIKRALVKLNPVSWF